MFILYKNPQQSEEPTLQIIANQLTEKGFILAQINKEKLEDHYDLRTENNYFEIFPKELPTQKLGYLFESPLEGVKTLVLFDLEAKRYYSSTIRRTFKELGFYLGKAGERRRKYYPKKREPRYVMRFEGDTLVLTGL